MIPRTYDWVAVLELMHKNIGCEDVPLKPELSWKFEGTRSRILGLSTSSHWDDILLEVDAQLDAKKSGRIDILIADAVSLKSDYH